MKKIMQKMGVVVGISLIAVLGVASFSSAESLRPERLEQGRVIQRSSLLGNLFNSWLSLPIFSGARNTDIPVMGRWLNPVVVQPGVASPVANGFSPTREPVSLCKTCGAGTVAQGSQCVASGSGNSSGNTTGNECDNENQCGRNESCVYDCTPHISQNQKKYCRVTADIKACLIECLSFFSKIATPRGEVGVIDLKVGDIVWTADALGNRIVRSLIKVSHTPAINHHVVHLVLADGRTLDVSAPHPTADGRTVGDLKSGDAYDGSTVRIAVLKAYEGSATYDILPAGDTGYYWANGIVMGSTLK